MAINRARVRQLHRILAPIMLAPILLTLTTGFLYQSAELSGAATNFSWLLELHIGHFGSLNLEVIYPFLNALGLLTLAITGITMWLQLRRHPVGRS